MKLLLKKEEEREKVKKKEQLEEEIQKHMKERMVQEMIEVGDPHPMDMEDIEAEDLVVQTSVENLMDWTPPKPNTHAHTRQSCGHFENGWIKSQSQACSRV